MRRLMNKFGIRDTVWVAAWLTLGLLSSLYAHAGSENIPPKVSILWPRQGDFFSVSTLIKIKSEATDADGSVAKVQFLVQTNLVGVVTNAPFNLIWQVGDVPGFDPTQSHLTLKAVAIDDSGAKSESAPVRIGYNIGLPPQPVVQIISPQNGAVFAAPATFIFSAEDLGSTGGDAGPVEFFVG